jgi:hypothetical protein
LTQPEDQGDAILVRQPKVNDKYVELSVDSQPLGCLAISGCFHLVPSLSKRRSQEALYLDFVLNEQKPHERILVHFNRFFMDGWKRETMQSQKTLQ